MNKINMATHWKHPMIFAKVCPNCKYHSKTNKKFLENKIQTKKKSMFIGTTTHGIPKLDTFEIWLSSEIKIPSPANAQKPTHFIKNLRIVTPSSFVFIPLPSCYTRIALDCNPIEFLQYISRNRYSPFEPFLRDALPKWIGAKDNQSIIQVWLFVFVTT